MSGATTDPQQATRLALDVEGIKAAHFSVRNNGALVGTTYDSITGQEYDVRRIGTTWVVNDDYGRDHLGLNLRQAIERARRTIGDEE